MTAVALLVYPGYGILFHTPASEPVAAAAFAAWALAVSRAWVAPELGRFAVVGAATAATALARPAFQVLVLVAALPLVLRLPWRTRLAARSPAPASHSGSWARGRSRTVSATTTTPSPAARGVLPVLPRLHNRPHRPPRKRPCLAGARGRGENGSCCPRSPTARTGSRSTSSSERGGPREFEDVVGITDRLWGWDSDYAHMRAVGIEAVEGASAPVRLRRRQDDLRGALEAALRRAAERRAARRRAARRVGRRFEAGDGARASGPDGWRGDSRGPSGILLDDSGRAHPRTVDVAGGSLARLRDAGDAAALRRDRARCGRSDGRGASLWRERVAHAPVQPIVEALPTADPVARRGARRPGRPAAEATGSRARAGRRRRCSSSAFRRSRSTRSSSLRSRSRRPSSSSVRRAWSGRARLPGPGRGKRDEPPRQERLKIRQPPGDESSERPPRRREAILVRRPGRPDHEPLGIVGYRSAVGDEQTVRRSPASQAG